MSFRATTFCARSAALGTGIACVAGAALAAGCGTSGVTNVVDPVAKAASASTATPGFAMTMSMRMTSAALPVPMTASGSGTFDEQDRSGAFNLAVKLPNTPMITQALGSNTLRMTEVMKGLAIYVRMPAAIAGKLPSGKPWLKVDLSKQATAMGVPGLSSLSSPLSTDPSQFLQYLRAVSGHVTAAGAQTVDGYHTTRYQATIDLSKVPSLLPAKNRAAARRSIQALESATHFSKLPVHVWIDNNHLVRRLTFSMNMTTQNVPLAMAMQMDIPRYGPQPAPKLPPASQVSDISSLRGAGTSQTSTGQGSA